MDRSQYFPIRDNSEEKPTSTARSERLPEHPESTSRLPRIWLVLPWILLASLSVAFLQQMETDEISRTPGTMWKPFEIREFNSSPRSLVPT